MTAFELAYRATVPMLSPLHGVVRRHLRHALETVRPASGQPVELLDVGGRKSHYTIGLPAMVTISELPRRSALQRELNLGLTDDLVETVRSRRSNVRTVVYDDMTTTRLAPGSFDCVVAVEVLEHVEADEAFVRNVARVLRPGGLFVMTTPNGDAVPIPHNADHKRHYPRAALHALLQAHFDEVAVHYAVVAGRARTLGLPSWTPRRPVRTLVAMAANLVNTAQSAGPSVPDDAYGTRHLVAVARTAR